MDIPVRHPNGDVAEYVGYADGVFKLPPKWLEPKEVRVLRFEKQRA